MTSLDHDPTEPTGSSSAPESHETAGGDADVALAEGEDDLAEIEQLLDGPDEEDDEEESEHEPEAAVEGAPAEAEDADGEDESKPQKLGPGEELSDDELDRQLLGILFASPDALSEAKLIELLDRPSRDRVRAAIERAQRALVDSPLPVLLDQVGGGWRLLTDPALGDVLRRSRKEAGAEKLSGAALETLAIVAYRQPVTKAEVEAIRGVQSGTLLRALVDRRMARVVGRADQPGAPLLYGTTKEFLDRFGLGSLKELPRDGELVRD